MPTAMIPDVNSLGTRPKCCKRRHVYYSPEGGEG